MLIVLVVLWSGCVLPPIQETVKLHFGADGEILVRVDVVFHEDDGEDGSRLAQRLAQRRRELEEDRSDWTVRLESLGEPTADGLELARSEGRLHRWARWIVLDDASNLGSLFVDAPLDAFVLAGDGEQPTQLVITPTAGDLAGREERRRVEKALDELTGALDQHLEAVAELYASLAEAPERAPAVLEHLFAAVVSEEVRAAAADLTPAEERLVERCLAAEEPLLEVFGIDGDEAFTLQESSRRVFDPFPADLEVSVQGQVLEAVGFERRGDVWRARRVGLWDAIERLEGRWVSPDPLLAKVAHWRGDASDFSVDEFIGDRVFEARPPLSGEVESALLSELAPWVEYRLAWLPQ